MRGISETDVLENYDLGFDVVCDVPLHELTDDRIKVIPNTIYFAPTNHLLDEVIERSTARGNRTVVLHTDLSFDAYVTDWRCRYLHSNECDIQLLSENGAIRGYFYTDLNIALVCNLLCEDSEGTREALKELETTFKSLREEKHSHDSVITISGGKVFTVQGGGTEVEEYAKALERVLDMEISLRETYTNAIKYIKKMYNRPPEAIIIEHELAMKGVSVTRRENRLFVYSPIKWVTDKLFKTAGSLKELPWTLKGRGTIVFILHPKDFTIVDVKLYPSKGVEVFHMLDDNFLCLGGISFGGPLISEGKLDTEAFNDAIDRVKKSLSIINITSLGRSDMYADIWHTLFDYVHDDKSNMFKEIDTWDTRSTWGQ